MSNNYARSGPFFASKAVTGNAPLLQGDIEERRADGSSVFSDFLSNLSKNSAFDLQAATTVNLVSPENQSTKPATSFSSNTPTFSSNTPTFSSNTPTFFSNAPAQSTDTNSNITNESSTFTPEKETITPDTQPLTAEEKFDVASGLEQQTLEDFSNLLSRLEASKMRQERKRAVEKRRDTMAEGLASMLGNF